MTDKLLSGEEQEALYEKFEQVEAAIGTDVHHRFMTMVDKLAGEAGQW